MPAASYRNVPDRVPLLIEGNFRPSLKERRIKALVVAASILSVIVLAVALGVYAINVNIGNHMNAVGKQTRDLNEANKELIVKLNKIRAYKNIESSAAKLSHLKPAQEMIEVTITPEQKKAMENVPITPVHEGEQPRVFGY